MRNNFLHLWPGANFSSQL
uniref:Uncharacterized protein n=1 Tax=Arundo donax TaxID=35708 RepID=A0A0A8Z6S3_ARUDO